MALGINSVQFDIPNISINYVHKTYADTTPLLFDTPVSEPDYSGNIDTNGVITLGAMNGIKDWLIQKWSYVLGDPQEYKSVDNKGINYNGCRLTDKVLAQYGEKIANDLNTQSSCYTGVKHALTSSGIIEHYGVMPKGAAKNAIKYFDDRPNKFKKIDVKNTEELKKLPAGCIIVYKNNVEKKAGHIAITNGNSQEYCDHTGNMNWNKENGGDINVYKLSDEWQYNPKNKKLEFKGKLDQADCISA